MEGSKDEESFIPFPASYHSTDRTQCGEGNLPLKITAGAIDLYLGDNIFHVVNEQVTARQGNPPDNIIALGYDLFPVFLFRMVHIYNHYPPARSFPVCFHENFSLSVVRSKPCVYIINQGNNRPVFFNVLIVNF